MDDLSAGRQARGPKLQLSTRDPMQEDHSLSRDALRRFLEGTASQEERGEIARHLLQGCRTCCTFLRGPLAHQLATTKLSYDEVSERARARVLAIRAMMPESTIVETRVGKSLGVVRAAGGQGLSVPSNDQPGSIEMIVEQLRDGPRREEAFRFLFDCFYGSLFRFFKRRVFSTEECQDLIQETFLRVWRGLDGYRGDAPFEHWLFRIARTTAGRAWRSGTVGKRAGRTVSWEEITEGSPPRMAGEHPLGEEQPAQLRRLLDKEKMELLRHAVARLPSKMRRCVRLRLFQGLDYQEIAKVLQISLSTVRVQLFKARKRLRFELGDAYSDLDL